MSDSVEFLSSYRTSINQAVMDHWPTHWLGIYEFESCLKASGDKEVYLAHDKRNNVALILRATATDSAESADAEWKILSRLNHSSVPKAYGSFAENGRSYIAREFFLGNTLDQVIAKAPLKVSATRAVAYQLAEILDYLHRQNPPVIHRDLKPQNIVLRPNGQIGLTDFGIARTFKPGAASDTQFIGTMPYAPPEQYGYAQSSPQTDIYAMGIVLIQLLTGSPDRTNLKQRITDPDLLAIIEKCIAFDPATRYQSAQQILKRLGKMESKKRKRLIVIGCGLVAVPLVGVGGWTIMSGLASSNTPIATSAPPATLAPTTSPTLAPTDEPSIDFPLLPAPPRDGAYLGGGNYPGNLSNYGFAVGGTDEIYVASDEAIIVLGLDGKFLRSYAAKNVESLNFYGGMLYYRVLGDVIRMNPLSGETIICFNASGAKLFIDSGRFYFDEGTDGLTLYTASLEGKDRYKVDDVRLAYFRQFVAGWQIYSETDDYELTLVNLATTETFKPGFSGNSWLTVWDGYLYYQPKYTDLFRRDLATGSQEILTRNNFDFMVATELGLFGLDTSTNSLDHISLDGRRNTLVNERTGFFCVAGDWIIYQQGEIDGPLRMVKIDGTADQPLPVG
ncbi:MAG: protein kinase [Propionibacteriaceae bacterium]|nr:protein kinase [Propionibacteriaceae bacterium]